MKCPSCGRGVRIGRKGTIPDHDKIAWLRSAYCGASGLTRWESLVLYRRRETMKGKP